MVSSPLVTGNTIWYDNHMDGGFSVNWDPVFVVSQDDYHNDNDKKDNNNYNNNNIRCCNRHLPVPKSWDFYFHLLNVNMKAPTARYWYQEGLQTGEIAGV
jgi:hypothetical protein